MTYTEPPPDDDLFIDTDGTVYPPIDPFSANLSAHSDPLVNVLTRIAVALEKLSAAPQNAPAPLGPPPASSVPPNGYGGPPARSGPDPVKMGKKVYAICRAQGWDVQDIGQRILSRSVVPNSQKWSVDDLTKVLDTLKEWGVG
jgi:hypothetical protein